MRTRPAYTWAQYLAANLDTKHTNLTYCAGQFARHEIPAKSRATGCQFKNSSNVGGNLWRVVRVTENLVYAVPALYVANYWE